ncbi:PLP-dependent aminotransferase family protein [Vreelandella utahensis]|uniref:aminotransferase-like domain-containing protein n=1 Tax=Vreelandella halophila TaxID=86177 RepID=UPI000985D1F3|nr:PLP-dependent aminotransferase family protein [Halomonas utahensis]
MGKWLYEDVAGQIAQQIEDSVYSPGDRLPGIRKLSQQFGVSLATAVEACQLLEDRGIIRARPRSGFYVQEPDAAPVEWRKPESTEDGPTLVTGQARVLELIRQYGDPALLPLGTAVPDPELLPLTALDRCIGHARRVHRNRVAGYDFPPGDESLRVQIARRMADAGCHISPDDVVITNGCQEAISLSLRAVANPGDVIAIESPTFYGILQAIESQGMRALELPTEPGGGIHPETLESAIQRWPIQACVAMPNYGNPLGHLASNERKEATVRLLADQGIPLIEDDVYGELGFTGDRPWAAKAWDTDGGILYCSSFSKTLGAGMRIGWAVPGRFRDQLTYLKYATNQAAPTLQTLALARFLDQGGYDRYLRRIRRIYQRQVNRVARGIQEHFPRGTRVSRPRGGFVLWVELPEHANTLNLQQDAQEEGISIAPGPLFSSTERFQRYLRVNCGIADADRVDAAIARLGRLTRKRT